jgi:hypothetical protein
MCHSQFFFLINQESNHHTDYHHSYVISHLVTPTNIIRFVKSFNKFSIFFIRLFITGKNTKPSLLIKRALRRVIKKII